jgi:hypothetical protein
MSRAGFRTLLLLGRSAIDDLVEVAEFAARGLVLNQ